MKEKMLIVNYMEGSEKPFCIRKNEIKSLDDLYEFLEKTVYQSDGTVLSNSSHSCFDLFEYDREQIVK